jgi:hypothetical protein
VFPAKSRKVTLLSDYCNQQTSWTATLPTLPTEILEKIFAAALPEEVIVHDARTTVLLYLCCTKYLEWTPKWAYELMTISKYLRVILGPLLYGRVVFKHWSFISKKLEHSEVASLLTHAPAPHSDRPDLSQERGVCQSTPHQFDQRVRKICGLPSACSQEIAESPEWIGDEDRRLKRIAWGGRAPSWDELIRHVREIREEASARTEELVKQKKPDFRQEWARVMKSGLKD